MDAVKELTIDELLKETSQEDSEEGGFTRLFNALAARWPEGPLRRLPRLYKALFADVKYKQGDDIATSLSQMEQAKRELEAEDKEAKVSNGILGYFWRCSSCS